jgi:hypothetical protein
VLSHALVLALMCIIHTGWGVRGQLYDKRDLLYDKRDILYDKRDLTLWQKDGKQGRTRWHKRPTRLRSTRSSMLTYADECWRMLTYVDVCWHMLTTRLRSTRSSMLTYADICWHILTYADICWRPGWGVRGAAGYRLVPVFRKYEREDQRRGMCFSICHVCVTCNMRTTDTYIMRIMCVSRITHLLRFVCVCVCVTHNMQIDMRILWRIVTCVFCRV